jgi:hypothetical protein
VSSETLILVSIDELGPAFPSERSEWSASIGTQRKPVYITREQLAAPGPIYLDGREWRPEMCDPEADTRKLQQGE